MLDELTWRERGRLWLRLGLRLGVAIASVWLLLRVGLPLLNLLMPFVAALILAWMLNPAIRFLQKKLGWKRNVLSLVLVLVCIFVLGALAAGLVYSLVSQVISFLQNWPPSPGRWRNFLSPFRGRPTPSSPLCWSGRWAGWGMWCPSC